jgi:hypothetical protein
MRSMKIRGTEIKGVFFNPRTHKYYARIKLGSKLWQIGTFDDESSAEAAYSQSALYRKHTPNQLTQEANRKQANAARKWIELFCEERKSFNSRAISHRLSQRASEDMGGEIGEISEASFIFAAISLGYRIKPHVRLSYTWTTTYTLNMRQRKIF